MVSVVLVRVLAGDVMLFSWARHFTLTVPLFAQVYEWVPAKLMPPGGNPAMDWHPFQGGVEILLVASCDRNCSDWPLGSYADLTYVWSALKTFRGTYLSEIYRVPLSPGF